MAIIGIVLETAPLQPLWATACLAGLAAITSIFNWLRTRKVHEDVKTIKIEINSRMDQLLAATKEAATLAGAAAEKLRAGTDRPESEDEQSGH